MESNRLTGLFLVAAGIILSINTEINITGAAIGLDLSKDASFYIGTAMLIIGLFLISSSIDKKMASKYYSSRKKFRDYYRDRALAILDKEKDKFPIWISQWELEGLEKKFDKMGIKYRGPESHLSGEPREKTNEDIEEIPEDSIRIESQRHLNIYGKNQWGRHIRKHLYITKDPYDIRLRKRSEEKGEVGRPTEEWAMGYDPSHPRSYILPKSKRESKKMEKRRMLDGYKDIYGCRAKYQTV